MRIAAIIVSMLFLSLASYAQQERELQKPGAAVQNNGSVAKRPATVPFTATAPRQMAPMGDKPVSTNGKHSTVPVPAGNQTRSMKPLNPNEPVKKN